MKKIVVRIIGGLGNQLFSYAAARRLALANGAELAIDHISGFSRDSYQRSYQLDHFRIPVRKAKPSERLEPFGALRRGLLRRYNARLPFEQRRYLFQEGVDFDRRLLDISPGRSLYIEGYWQSQKYFEDVESTIRSDLTIVPPTDMPNIALAETIRTRVSIGVHVRFFDVPDVAQSNNAPGSYYRKAVETMQAAHPNAHYYVFSDRPGDALKLLNLDPTQVTLIDHNIGDENAYADFWLLTQCKHFIIANSTFSWWGAWLGDYPGKTVIAPGFEIRTGSAWWGFSGLIPEAWQTV